MRAMLHAEKAIMSVARTNTPLDAVQDQLQPGDQLPELRLVSLDGAETTLPELARQVKVLAVLTTTCPFCAQSLPAWNDVAEELEGHAMGFAGISLHPVDQTRDYVRDNGIAWPVLVAELSAVRALGFNGNVLRDLRTAGLRQLCD